MVLKKLENYIHSYKKILIGIILALILFSIGSTVYFHSSSYVAFNYWERFPALKSSYLNSQYVNKHPKGWIPDEAVNAYAGGEYIKGLSPVLIAPDTPPLGRYLIGLSAVVFDNENIIILIAGCFSFFFMYLLGEQIFHNTMISLIALLLVSLEPIIKNQFVYVPLLDIMQLAFLLGSFYYFNKGIKFTKKMIIYFLLATVFLGCFISTKFFATGITIVLAWYIVLLLHKKWYAIKWLTALLPISIIVLFLTYSRVFSFKSYTLFSFLGIQKYIYLYHKSQFILPFSIWPLLLFNHWYTWWGNIPVISDPQWQFTWPIVTILSFVTLVLYILRKIPHELSIEVCMVWAVCYVLFLSVGQITSRYLIILLPILYLISIYGIISVVKKI